MPPKWSSGRACGAASTTQRTRSASLRSHALMDKMEKKKDARRSQTTSKNYVHFQQNRTTNAPKWYQKRNKIIEMMLEGFPWRLEACEA